MCRTKAARRGTSFFRSSTSGKPDSCRSLQESKNSKVPSKSSSLLSRLPCWTTRMLSKTNWAITRRLKRFTWRPTRREKRIWEPRSNRPARQWLAGFLTSSMLASSWGGLTQILPRRCYATSTTIIRKKSCPLSLISFTSKQHDILSFRSNAWPSTQGRKT